MASLIVLRIFVFLSRFYQEPDKKDIMAIVIYAVSYCLVARDTLLGFQKRRGMTMITFLKVL